MKFEDYQNIMRSNARRSLPLNILFAFISFCSFVLTGGVVYEMFINEFDLFSAIIAVAFVLIGIYGGLCVIDGRSKTMREALADLLLLLPL